MLQNEIRMENFVQNNPEVLFLNNNVTSFKLYSESNELKLRKDLETQKNEIEEAYILINSISRITTELSSLSNLQSLLGTYLIRLSKCLSASKGILLVFTNEPSILEVYATYNTSAPVVKEKINISTDAKILFNVLRTCKPQRIETENFLGISSKYMLCVPIKSENGLLGILCLFDKQKFNGTYQFTDSEEASAVSVTNQVSSQWQKIRIFEMAIYDVLTNLYNRRFLDHKLLDEVKRARRHEKPLSIMLIDIDHFKKFNDNYGHHVGDDVLRSVSGIIKNSVRSGIDIVARFGGEEIMVIMPETDVNGAVVLAERIRTAVQGISSISPYNTMGVKLTVSIGVSSFPEHSTSISKLVELSDDALYKSKSDGRNKVSVCLS